MKKLLSTILALSLLLGMSAGCGSTASSSAPAPASSDAGSAADSSTAPAEVQKLVYWNPLSGGDGDIMKAMVEKFNAENPDINVEMLLIKNDEYYTKLQTAMMSGQSPDIAIIHASRLGEFAPEGLLVPLDEIAAQAGLDWNEYNQNRLSATIFDGKHMAIPHDTQMIAMFYNRALLADTGLLDAEGNLVFPTGKDELTAFLKTMKEKVPQDAMVISASTGGMMPYYVWYSLYVQAGGKLVDDAGKPTFNNEANRKVLQYIYDLVFVEQVWPQNIKSGGEIFTAGKGVININGGWSTSTFEKNKDTLDFGVAPFPQVFDKPGVWGESHTLVLPVQKNADPAKQLAAVKFADWLTDNGAMWAQAGHVPIKPAIMETEEFKALPYRSVYADSANYAFDIPATSYTTGMIDIISAQISALIAGQQDVDTCLATTQEKLDVLANQ